MSERWAPRMWIGCCFPAWRRLMLRNHFAVRPSCLYIAAIDTAMSVLNSTLSCVQQAVWGKAIEQSTIEQPPIFIIGHWRSGTTLLHELLALDTRHVCPTTYQCFSPNHFLLTERWFKKWFSFVLPKYRPMDNMAVGWSRPQEDEFAVCNLGQPSPYLTIAFPNHPPTFTEYFELQDIPPAALADWRRAYLTFLKQVVYRKPQRLVLKSPTHTFRIPVLQAMFPQARFVHLVRDPYALFISTVHMWKSMYQAHGFQTPTFDGLEDYVLEVGLRMFQRLEETRSLVAPGRFHQLRYEDLVADPMGAMQRLYEELELGEFPPLRPRLEAYLPELRSHRANRYDLSPQQCETVRLHWRSYFQNYGYPTA